LFTNQRRFRRGLTSSAACPFCSSPETTEHLFLHCNSIQPFWRAIPSLHDNVAQCDTIRDLWDGSPLCKVRSSVIICALWITSNIARALPRIS
jgi:hypothetical protein